MRAIGVVAALVSALVSTAVTASPVLLISLDGLRPEDVAQAKAHGLKLPAMTELATGGATAEGVTGVLPTLTYPSHTTLVTGAAPARHGIDNNLTLDPGQKNQTGWYWYASDVRLPTLWQVAHAAGLRTANVHWPVTVGAPGIDANLPQIWRAGTADDPKLLTALATPGLLPRLEKAVGVAYPQGIDETVEGDAGRVRFAKAMLADKPQFMTVYMAGIDHAEHHGGPGSLEARAAIEQTDALVGDLVTTARAAMPDITIVLVSDHGFLPVTTDINLFRPFIDAGLITLDAKGQVTAWKAMPWLAGGTAAVVLAEPEDADLTARTAKILATIAADPAYHIAGVLDRSAIRRRGGATSASFFISMAPGYETGRDPAAPIAQPSVYKGMHGYDPSNPAMRSTLIVAGPSIKKGSKLGIVDMRAIAPSIAHVLGVSLATAEAPPVF